MSVVWICEFCFISEGNGVEPFEDLETSTQTTLGPLRSVVVGVDETWDEELGRVENTKVRRLGF